LLTAICGIARRVIRKEIGQELLYCQSSMVHVNSRLGSTSTDNNRFNEKWLQNRFNEMRFHY